MHSWRVDVSKTGFHPLEPRGTIMGSHPPNSSPSVDGAPLSHCIFNFGNLFLVHSRHRKTNDLSKSIFFESVIGVWAAEGEIKFDGN